MARSLHIGVVIAARDMAAWIGTCLSSLLDQTHRDWTAIIVDDGSRDGTAAVVACFRDPRIRLISQSNAGVSAARNRGLAEVEGDAVLFLDADDWLATDALARMAAMLASNPDAAAVWGRFALMRGIAEPGHRPVRVVRPRVDGPGALAALLVGNRFANGGHVLVRRSAAARAGRFNTRLGFGEDWEYWVRLALVGPLVPVPGAEPLLFVRQRDAGAYRSRVTDLAAFVPASLAIFLNPEVQARFPPDRLRALQRAGQAEQAWIAGRAMLELGQATAGLRLLRQSVRMRPTPRRLGLLAALHVVGQVRAVTAPATVRAESAGVADPR
jgi:glycosyltransferase involved in cell wall biosynthesis